MSAWSRDKRAGRGGQAVAGRRRGEKRKKVARGKPSKEGEASVTSNNETHSLTNARREIRPPEAGNQERTQRPVRRRGGDLGRTRRRDRRKNHTLKPANSGGARDIRRREGEESPLRLRAWGGAYVTSRWLRLKRLQRGPRRKRRTKTAKIPAKQKKKRKRSAGKG